MKPNGKRHRTVPIQLGGQFSAGDPSAIPDGFVSILRNYMIRANRFDGRAPFVYDSLDAVSGFAIWQDMANELQKTVATCSADNKLYTKNSNGQGYGTGLAGLTASIRLTGYTNILGKLYMAFDNGAGVPTATAVYDGTNLSMTPFNSTVNARDIESFIDRAFLINPRPTTVNLLSVTASPASTLPAYALDNATYWTLTNVTATSTTESGATVVRLIPNSTAANACQIASTSAVTAASIAASSTDRNVIGTIFLRNTSDANVPITLELFFASSTLVFYPGGSVPQNLIFTTPVGGVNYIFQATTGGTVGAAPPAWNAAIGSTTADNTVVWTNVGRAVLGALQTTCPADGQWARYDVPIVLNKIHAAIKIGLRLKFYNDSQSALTNLVAIDATSRDGIADGDPSKANYGWQITSGDFYYPFFNAENTNTNTSNLDAVIWSEITNPKQILARNTYPLTEIAGLATASIVSNGRLVVFKRSGMWIFKGTADPYEPILPESPALQVGCVGPLALACSRDNVLYWIGENHVYKMAIGSDTGPTEIDSPGMFEEIFARGSNWVESQSTYNMPLLAIDHANKDVWVYTQKGKIYIYSIQSGLWSYLDTNPTGTSAEVRAMIFDPTSNRMLVSFGGAAATRFDETSDAQDSIVTGGGTPWNIANDIVPKPFELFAPRFEASLLEVGLFHLASIQNGSLTISYSYDRGATYTTPAGYPVTSWLTNPRIRLCLAATGESVTIKLSRVGAGGRRNFAISKADALIRVHRGEAPKVNPS